MELFIDKFLQRHSIHVQFQLISCIKHYHLPSISKLHSILNPKPINRVFVVLAWNVNFLMRIRICWLDLANATGSPELTSRALTYSIHLSLIVEMS